MKKIVRLTESDLVKIVKRVINENDDKSTFEVKIETTPENQLDSVIEDFFSNKTETETQQYFMELNNRKPKWLKKLIRWFHKNKNNKKPLGKDESRRALTAASIYLIVYQIFREKIKDFVQSHTDGLVD